MMVEVQELFVRLIYLVHQPWAETSQFRKSLTLSAHALLLNKKIQSQTSLSRMIMSANKANFPSYNSNTQLHKHDLLPQSGRSPCSLVQTWRPVISLVQFITETRLPILFRSSRFRISNNHRRFRRKGPIAIHFGQCGPIIQQGANYCGGSGSSSREFQNKYSLHENVTTHISLVEEGSWRKATLFSSNLGNVLMFRMPFLVDRRWFYLT